MKCFYFEFERVPILDRSLNQMRFKCMCKRAILWVIMNHLRCTCTGKAAQQVVRWAAIHIFLHAFRFAATCRPAAGVLYSRLLPFSVVPTIGRRPPAWCANSGLTLAG